MIVKDYSGKYWTGIKMPLDCTNDGVAKSYQNG